MPRMPLLPSLPHPPLAPLTQWSMGGLDRIQQHNFYMAGQLVNMTGLDPTMGSDFYTWVRVTNWHRLACLRINSN